MKTEVWASLAGALIVAGSSAARDLVVSPGGLSPQAALEKIRAAKARGDKSAWTVRVKGGLYTLAEPLVLTPSDSGTSAAPVRWVGERGRSVFAGGSAIGGWRNDGDGVWSAPLPTGPDGKPAFFEQLWVNGRRATLAKSPNERYHYIRQTIPGIGKRGMYVHKEDLAPLAKLSKEKLGRVIFRIWWSWERESNRIARMDADKGTVELEKDFLYDIFRWRSQGKETRYTLENYREALDAPGEFFIEKGELLYIPREGETLETVRAVAPKANGLLVFRGDPAKGEIVRDVTVRRVGFEHSAFTPVLGDVVPHQSGINMGIAAIQADGAENLRFEWEKGQVTFIIQDLDGYDPEDMISTISFKVCVTRNM